MGPPEDRSPHDTGRERDAEPDVDDEIPPHRRTLRELFAIDDGDDPAERPPRRPC